MVNYPLLALELGSLFSFCWQLDCSRVVNFIRSIVARILWKCGVVQLLLQLWVYHFCHVVKYLIDLFVHFCAHFMVPYPILCCQVPPLLFRHYSVSLGQPPYCRFACSKCRVVTVRINIFVIVSFFGWLVTAYILVFLIIFVVFFIRQVDFVGNQNDLHIFSCFLVNLLHPFS